MPYDDWFDPEAIEDRRRDADLYMADLEAAAAAAQASRAAGLCPHQSFRGYVHPAPTMQQQALKPGQVICTDQCSRVFDSKEELLREADERSR